MREYIQPQEDAFGRLLLTIEQMDRITKMFDMYDDKEIDREQLFLKIIEIVVVKPNTKKPDENTGMNNVKPV